MPTIDTPPHLLALPTLTIQTPAPRTTALAHARSLVRRHQVPLHRINYRRAPDGTLMVSAPGHRAIRFTLPTSHELIERV